MKKISGWKNPRVIDYPILEDTNFSKEDNFLTDIQNWVCLLMYIYFFIALELNYIREC